MRYRYLALALIALLAPWAEAQERPAAPREINKAFESPDVEQYIKRFESESREVYAQRRAIVRAIGLKPGMAVADIGAGTGLFTRLFATEVGPKGKVYAVDISPAFLEHINKQAKQLGHEHVETRKGSQESTELPSNSIEVAFLCDTYHHLEKPKAVLASIHRALKPGGRLVVVDFDRREGVSSAFVLEHVRANKETFIKEIESAGFEQIETGEPPKLKENFFLQFRKVEPTKGATGEDGRR
ncbi:MAG: methyltransferase domain-containing protein [Isosphaeraceae bacterium]|nr:methyltransferase domain-containing protein [Isosphaeraceae bacterium]